MPRSIDGKRGTSLGVLTAAVLLAGLLSPAASPAASDRTDADFAAAREAMVTLQIAARGVRDPEVLAALRATPRHRFVPPDLVSRAYDDTPLPIGHGQTISQPYIVAFMTEILRPRKDHRVLEIGTGSGYQAAILAALVREVFTMEIVPALAASAGVRLKEMGYGNVRVAKGDGYHGWPQHAPFDAIIVTAAAGHIPPPLVAQLRQGGRMVIPVGGPFAVQSLVLVSKDSGGGISTENLMAVRFVPLTGGNPSP
ncbi:MAG TPA: protein-L-isoaspartate(D-aspartate) O-methyltransferase [Syntrophales bacterium]|nr:protein-L-isoaspartate(D-aspartate) O-methyltransferase [Syntrophales bacterium]